MNAHPDGGTIYFDVGAQTACKFVAAPPPAREMRLCVRLRDARMTLDMGCSVHIAGAAPAGGERRPGSRASTRPGSRTSTAPAPARLPGNTARTASPSCFRGLWTARRRNQRVGDVSGKAAGFTDTGRLSGSWRREKAGDRNPNFCPRLIARMVNRTAKFGPRRRRNAVGAAGWDGVWKGEGRRGRFLIAAFPLFPIQIPCFPCFRVPGLFTCGRKDLLAGSRATGSAFSGGVTAHLNVQNTSGRLD